MPVSTIESALEDLRQGRMIIIVDDEDRENEGDVTVAAEMVTPEIINFMVTHCRGLICLSMTPERLAELHLPPMVTENTSPYSTAFTVSIEARQNVTTGISAADRATTILTAIDPSTRPSDLARPGHIFPLRARPGGVLERAGQTEASVDMARIAGMYPAGVICEIMNEDGTMARMPQLEVFAERFGLKIVTTADLIRYRLRTEKFVQEVERAPIDTEYGRFNAVVFRNRLDGRAYLALTLGDLSGDEPVHVRVQTQSVPGDVFLSREHGTGRYLQECMRFIAGKGRGVVLYLPAEDPSGRMEAEVRALRLAHEGNAAAQDALHPVEEEKHYGIGAQVLTSLGLRKVILLTGRPRPMKTMAWYGLDIVSQVDILHGASYS